MLCSGERLLLWIATAQLHSVVSGDLCCCIRLKGSLYSVASVQLVFST